jgi:GNAT superfamily N-acetyltransferase
MTPFHLLEYDHLHPDFVALTQALDGELAARNGCAQQAYLGLNKLDGIANVVVAYAGDRPAACGSFKVHDGQTAEVKRVFVDPAYRGQGLSKALMGCLEARARRMGFSTLILETSRNFAEANGLYSSLGYTRTDAYGPYVGMADSVCYRKELVP